MFGKGYLNFTSYNRIIQHTIDKHLNYLLLQYILFFDKQEKNQPHKWLAKKCLTCPSSSYYINVFCFIQSEDLCNLLCLLLGNFTTIIFHITYCRSVHSNYNSQILLSKIFLDSELLDFIFPNDCCNKMDMLNIFQFYCKIGSHDTGSLWV